MTRITFFLIYRMFLCVMCGLAVGQLHKMIPEPVPTMSYVWGAVILISFFCYGWARAKFAKETGVV